MRKVAILDVGRRNFQKSLESTRDIAELLSGILQKNKIDSEILTTLTANSVEKYSAFVFLTRGVLSQVVAFKKNYPHKKVVLFTGANELEDVTSGILFVQKGTCDAFEEISRLVM